MNFFTKYKKQIIVFVVGLVVIVGIILGISGKYEKLLKIKQEANDKEMFAMKFSFEKQQREYQTLLEKYQKDLDVLQKEHNKTLRRFEEEKKKNIVKTIKTFKDKPKEIISRFENAYGLNYVEK